MTVAIAGLIILMVSGTSLTGYILHRSSFYQWVGSVGMAVNTSICFVATGAALLIIGLSRSWH